MALRTLLRTEEPAVADDRTQMWRIGEVHLACLFLLCVGLLIPDCRANASGDIDADGDGGRDYFLYNRAYLDPPPKARFTNDFWITVPNLQADLLTRGDNSTLLLLVAAGEEIGPAVPPEGAWKLRQDWRLIHLIVISGERLYDGTVERWKYWVRAQTGPLAENPEGYVAARVPQEGGWRYGWIRYRIEQPLVVLDRAVFHPEVDKPIRAGREPFPRLQNEQRGEELLLWWDPDETGFTLQRTEDLSQPAWTPVPGVVDNQVLVPLSGASGFFRLYKP